MTLHMVKQGFLYWSHMLSNWDLRWGGLTLKIHLKIDPKVTPFWIPFWYSHSPPIQTRILTFTFPNLEGFIVIWRITFWFEFFFSQIINLIIVIECHIRLHGSIHVKRFFLANEFSNPTLGNTCLILYCFAISSSFA